MTVTHDSAGAMQDTIWLSVLVAVPRGADPTAWCQLAALPDADRCALILACAEATPPLYAPDAEVVCCAGATLFQLWAKAIAQARGTHVAIVDARCPPSAGWLRAAREAVAQGLAAFFGPVSYGGADDDRARVEYVLEYGQFARPLAVGLREVPGNNLVFRRDLLDAQAVRGGEFHKVFFVASLRRSGVVPAYRDDLEVLYAKRYPRVHYLRRRLAHGRTYAALRSAQVSMAQRLLRMLTSPVLPLLRLGRIAAAVSGKPGLGAVLLRRPIHALAAETAWSLGECAGYVSGQPGSSVHLD